MNLPLFIARRLRFKPHHSRSLSPGIAIAIAGMAISLVIMMMSIAIVTGFKHQIRDKIMGFDSQITISPRADLMPQASTVPAANLSGEIKSIIEKTLPHGATYRPMVEMPVIIKTPRDFRGLIIRGLPQEGQAHDFIVQNIAHGHYPSSFNEIAISKATADALALTAGDKTTLHFLLNGKIRTRRYTIAGIYDTHFADYDSRLAFCPISTLQAVAKLTPAECTSITIEGLDANDIEPTADALHSSLLNAATSSSALPVMSVTNVYYTGALYFNWLSLLDTNVTVILILMALVSGFTLISSTFIIILERVKMIGILKTIGMSNGNVRKVFIHMAQRIVLWGLLIGNAIGLGVLTAQRYLNIIPLDADAYYLNYVPVEINVWHILLLNIAVVILSTLMLLIPTAIISGMSPASTVKYE